MILIFSQHNEDSTNDIISWLKYYNYPFIRLNTLDIVDYGEMKVQIENESIEFNFKINNKIIDISDIGSVWFRRWWEPCKTSKIIDDKDLNFAVQKNLNGEIKSISKYLFYLLKDKYWLNHPDNVQISKLIQLDSATKAGLSISNTIVSNRKKDLLCFQNRHKGIITKPINESLSYNNLAFYTSEVSQNEINEYNDNIFPSMLQQQIDKSYEIRVFFIENSFYAVALFTQQYENSNVDSRKISFNSPYRIVPYILPNFLIIRLKKLVKKLRLNSGSIDLIKDINGDFIFLEVNPVGQFGYFSRVYNDEIEKNIARILIEKDKEYERK